MLPLVERIIPSRLSMSDKINCFPINLSLGIVLYEWREDGPRIVWLLPFLVVAKQQVENATQKKTRLVQQRRKIEQEHATDQNKDWASPVHHHVCQCCGTHLQSPLMYAMSREWREL